eukprot:scpid103891/ scgid24533/ 
MIGQGNKVLITYFKYHKCRNSMTENWSRLVYVKLIHLKEQHSTRSNRDLVHENITCSWIAFFIHGITFITMMITRKMAADPPRMEATPTREDGLDSKYPCFSAGCSVNGCPCLHNSPEHAIISSLHVPFS